MSDFRNSVHEVVSIALELTRSRAIWWEIARKENTEKYALTMKAHWHFYAALRFSLEQGMFVMICQLFETRKDTKSIPNLIRELDGPNSDVAKKLRLEVQSLKPLLGKMFHVRGGVYAHRNRQSTPHDIFNKAGITPRHLETVVLAAEDLVASLADVAGIAAARKVKMDLRQFAEEGKKGAALVLHLLQVHRLRPVSSR
jgi:hypothetical protein